MFISEWFCINLKLPCCVSEHVKSFQNSLNLITVNLTFIEILPLVCACYWYTTRWVLLEVGKAMGCAISPSLFVKAMKILLKATGSNILEAQISKGVNMSPIKAFVDDSTMNRVVFQNAIDKSDGLLGWYRMAFKHAKSGVLPWLGENLQGCVLWCGIVEKNGPTAGSQSTMDYGPNRGRVKAGCRYKEIISSTLLTLSTLCEEATESFQDLL